MNLTLQWQNDSFIKVQICMSLKTIIFFSQSLQNASKVKVVLHKLLAQKHKLLPLFRFRIILNLNMRSTPPNSKIISKYFPQSSSETQRPKVVLKKKMHVDRPPHPELSAVAVKQQLRPPQVVNLCPDLACLVSSINPKNAVYHQPKNSALVSVFTSNSFVNCHVFSPLRHIYKQQQSRPLELQSQLRIELTWLP